MRLTSIELTDFRGFDEARFDFNPHFNVVVGENGQGKTSLLEAVAVAINSFVAVVEGRNVRGLKKEDVRRISYEQSVETRLLTSLRVSGELNGVPAEWQVGKANLHWGFMQTKDRAVKDYAKQLVGQLAEDGGPHTVLPVFAYLGSGRLWTESTEKVKLLPKGSRLQGYRYCLSAKGSFRHFAEWFKTMELSGLQDTPAAVKAKFNAQVIKRAVAQCLEGWDDLYYSVADDMLMARRGSQQLPFSYLSDGQRNVIGLVADIAYRCVLLNPYLGRQATELTPGIVLIDELDLHLHPNWQKRIVANLKETFPLVQFITTSHSPFIVQSLEREELISLDRDHISADPFRRSIEEVAESDMGVHDVLRSKRFQDMEQTAARYFDLIAQNDSPDKIAQVKRELDELEAEFNDDPAYVALLRAERKASEQ